MAIQPETLNAMLVAFDAHTGVFKSNSARIAVVVKVGKDGKVYYLHLSPDCRIVLEISPSRETFLRDYPIELYHYPVLRAVRKYASYVRKDGFPITDEARKVINAIIAR